MNASKETPLAGPISSRGRHSSAARPDTNTQSTNSSTAAALPKRSWLPVGLFSMLLIMTGVAITMYSSGALAPEPDINEAPTATAIPSVYDPARAFEYLGLLCNIGPRPSASAGMQKQQQLLMDFFSERGAQVQLQTFQARHPNDGSAVPMANLIATWQPEAANRFLLCAHYDTRPFPDRDRQDKRGVFVGANDGASGTAALMELSHQLSQLPPDLGVDIVLFDGEEFVFQERRDEYFLGSTYFAQQYVAQPPPIAYRAGILLDMVGDRELKLYFEQNSIRFARDVAHSVWSTAKQLQVQAFVPRVRHELRDDHLPLNQIAHIPTIDIIDFDYPRPGIGAPTYWHTTQDVPENCSGQSLAAVVWVVHTWLLQQSQQR